MKVKPKKKGTKKPKELKYSCPNCDKRFADRSSWRCHVSLHTDEEPYKCDLCDYKCKIKKYLARHKKKAHTKPTGNQCKICGKCFHFDCKLRDHMRVHTGEKPYKCKYCDKAFSSSYSLNNHNYIHTGEKPFQCTYCEYSCRDNSTIRRHIERHRGVSKDYPCFLCSKSFKKKDTLQMHMDEVHFELDTRKFPCEQCDKVFKTKGTLSIHVRTIHMEGNRIRCEICGCKITKNNVQSHMRRHIDVKPYQCSFKPCGRRFKDKGDLKKHSLIHYPERQHACALCQRLFARRSRWRAHTRLHLDMHYNVQCDHCGGMFSTKIHLSRHIQKKHGANSKDYICDICGLVTYSRRVIIMHLKYGHGTENDTKCKICNRDYKKYLNIKDHYLRRHNIKYSLLPKKKEESNNPIIIKQEEPYEEFEVINNDSEFIYEVQVQKHEENDDFEEINAPVRLKTPTPNNSPTYTIDSDTITYSKKVLSEDISRSLLERDNDTQEDAFDDFFIGHVMKKPEEHIVMPRQIVDKKRKERVEQCLEKLLSEVRIRKELKALAKLRKKYNKRIKMASRSGNKKEKTSIRYFKKPEENKNSTNSTNDVNSEETRDVNNDDRIGDDKNIDNNGANINIDKDTANIDIDNDNANINIDKDSGNINTTKDSSNIDIDMDSAKIDIDNDNTNINMDKDSVYIDIDNDNLNSNVDKDNPNSNVDKNSPYINIDKDSPDIDIDNNKSVNINIENISANINTDNNNDSANITIDNDNANINNDKDKNLNDKDTADIVQDHGNDVSDKVSEAKTGDNDDKSDDQDIDNDDVKDSDFELDSEDGNLNRNGKLKFNTHQCYICFKLFKTKTELTRHGRQHFDLCNDKMLKKCPFCGYVTNLQIAKHIRNVHKVAIDIPYGRIKERDTQHGSKYVFQINKDCDLEIIPSISNLNKIASMKIDEKNRESKNIFMGTTKLVKKGNDWMVEKQPVSVSNDYLLPEFTDEDYKSLQNVGNTYLERIKSLSILAKKKGGKILYPCEGCDKICLTLSALKLHNRRHEANPKAYRPKVWKNKILNGYGGNSGRKTRKKYVNKNKGTPENETSKYVRPTNTKHLRNGRLHISKNGDSVTPDKNVANRFADPNPVRNKHKCDKELIEFYKNNIKGGDIEFWQFLKIFNKMSRENVNDFKDLENRYDFGMHNIRIDEPAKDAPPEKAEPIVDNSRAVRKAGKSKKKVLKKAFTRTIMISKKEYLRRIEIKNQMRKSLEESAA